MRTERSRARKLLQWGHALSSMECRNETWRGFVARLCFNGAMLFRAWNAESHRIRNHCNLGFNGAMLFRAWNGSLRFRTTDLEQASMGPCSFEHGMGLSSAPEEYKAALQWGHALSSMECPIAFSFTFTINSFNGAMLFRAWNAADNLRRNISVTASMGPCSFEHGMIGLTSFDLISPKLQWGHALSSME